MLIKKNLFSHKYKDIQIDEVIRLDVKRSFTAVMDEYIDFWEKGFNNWTDSWEETERIFLANKGYPLLKAKTDGDFKKVDAKTFFLNCSTPHLLDFVHIFKDTISPDKVKIYLEEINTIFEINKLPFEFLEDEIIYNDSQFFKNNIKEAVELFNETGFENAKREFFEAQSFFKEKRYEDALKKAHDALDSTMAYIVERDLLIDDKPKENKTGILINVLKKQGYFRSYQEKLSTHIGCLLEEIPVLRNKIKGAGHSRGTAPDEDNKAFAQLALNMSASVIIFLIKRFKELSLTEEDISF